ncbi:MAG: histidine phosphatase family protein [Patescibacteria group bacterium]
MKRLVVVRHGNSPGDDLTEAGRFQAERLGQSLRALCNGDAFVIATSDKNRARQTGVILAEQIGGTPIETVADECVAQPLYFEDEFANLMKRLADRADIVIAVSHQMSVQRIVKRQIKGLGLTWVAPEIVSECAGFVLDYEAKTITPISH